MYETGLIDNKENSRNLGEFLIVVSESLVKTVLIGINYIRDMRIRIDMRLQ